MCMLERPGNDEQSIPGRSDRKWKTRMLREMQKVEAWLMML